MFSEGVPSVCARVTMFSADDLKKNLAKNPLCGCNFCITERIKFCHATMKKKTLKNNHAHFCR